MTEDELGRLLGRAFDDRARSAVGDDAPRPEPRFAAPPALRTGTGGTDPTDDAPATLVGPSRRRRLRVLAPIAAAAAVIAAVATGVALSHGDGGRTTAAGHTTGGRPSGSASAWWATPTMASPGARPVRMSFTEPTGSPVGVGMPVIARFDRTITDARSLSAVTQVLADGRPLDARWYFVRSSAPGHPLEGHLRPRDYWPAHAHISVVVRAAHVSAGTGLGFAGNVQTAFTTGAATIATVDARTHLMSVHRDGRAVGQFRVSLGAAATPTLTGIKVIMAKVPSVCLHDVNGTYYACGIRDAQQLTSSGEYLHAAPWNFDNIGKRNTSNGCTNLRPADARALYTQLEVGDVVVYRDTGGPAMALADGLGDWDVPWSTWSTGGLVPTTR